MSTPPKKCFLDKERTCAAECKAYKEKDDTCRLINNSNLLASGISQLQRWLASMNPPRIT